MKTSWRRKLAKFDVENWMRAVHVGESGPSLYPLVNAGLLEKIVDRDPHSHNVPVTKYRLTEQGKAALA